MSITLQSQSLLESQPGAKGWEEFNCLKGLKIDRQSLIDCLSRVLVSQVVIDRLPLTGHSAPGNTDYLLWVLVLRAVINRLPLTGLSTQAITDRLPLTGLSAPNNMSHAKPMKTLIVTNLKLGATNSPDVEDASLYKYIFSPLSNQSLPRHRSCTHLINWALLEAPWNKEEESELRFGNEECM
ncbi:hypothetical protein CR513_54951, partial [Mucuna pruriens]